MKWITLTTLGEGRFLIDAYAIDAVEEHNSFTRVYWDNHHVGVTESFDEVLRLMGEDALKGAVIDECSPFTPPTQAQADAFMVKDRKAADYFYNKFMREGREHDRTQEA